MTPDTPEKMSADELAAICERDAAVGALIARGALIPGPVVMAALDDRGRLLRHIDAIETKQPARPVASFDRDALGRELSSMLGKTPVQWEELSEGYRSRAMAAAVALHVLGAASRQGEIDALRAEVEQVKAWWTKDVKEERENERRQCEREMGEVLAKLDAARGCGQPDVCATPPGCARHWEERNRELAADLATQRTSANAVIDALEARVRAFQRATGEPDAEAVTPEMVEARIAGLTADLANHRTALVEALDRERAKDALLAKAGEARAEGARDERVAIVPLLVQLTDAIRARGQAK